MLLTFNMKNININIYNIIQESFDFKIFYLNYM